MLPSIFDTHCHLGMEPLNQDTEGVLRRAQAKGVSLVLSIAIGSSVQEIERQLRDFQGMDGVYLAIGVHPHDVEDFSLSKLNELERFLDHPKVLAIGEVGLDLHYRSDNLERQKEFFGAFLEMAAKRGLPVVIHSREAQPQTLDVLQAFPKGTLKGIFHCFSYTHDVALKGLDHGFLASFAGNLTFKRADGLREVARALPLDALLVETDAPFLAPEPFRGKTNEPAFIIETVRTLSKLKEISLQELAEATTANAKKLLGVESA